MMVAWVLPGVAVPMVGAPGIVAAAGVMNKPNAHGCKPTGTVAITVLLPVLITDTLLLLTFAT